MGGAATEGREQEQHSHHPSKPLQARKRNNKYVTLHPERTQACHSPNEVGQDQACSAERAALRGGQAQYKAYCLAGLAPSVLLSLTYKPAGSLGDTATPSLAGPVAGRWRRASPWYISSPGGDEGTRQPQRACFHAQPTGREGNR